MIVGRPQNHHTHVIADTTECMRQAGIVVEASSAWSSNIVTVHRTHNQNNCGNMFQPAVYEKWSD